MIAHGHRTIEQDNDPRDEIWGDWLKPEAKTDTKGAAEHCQRSKIDAHDLQQKEEHDKKHCNFEQLCENLASSDIEIFLAANDLLPGGVRYPSQPKQDGAEKEHPYNAVHWQFDISDMQPDAVQIAHDLIEPPEDVQQSDGNTHHSNELS